MSSLESKKVALPSDAREGEKVVNISQAKRVVVVGGESIRVNRIVRIEGELFEGGGVLTVG